MPSSLTSSHLSASTPQHDISAACPSSPHGGCASPMHQRLDANISEALRCMLEIRRHPRPWQFLLSIDPLADAKIIRSPLQMHHAIAGYMHTTSCFIADSNSQHAPDQQQRQPPRDLLATAAAAQVAERLALTTTWVFVPAFIDGNISVGAVIGENVDSTHILFQDAVTRRFTRYARDETTGAFFVVMINPDDDIIEILFMKHVTSTHRLRTFMRFNYANFTAALKTSARHLNLKALNEALHVSNIVHEYRYCPECNSLPETCSCVLQLRRPRHSLDLECNALNMCSQIGEFVGTSIHSIYMHGKLVHLSEHLTQCDMAAKIHSGDAPKLLNWAVQNRLSLCKMSSPTSAGVSSHSSLTYYDSEEAEKPSTTEHCTDTSQFATEKDITGIQPAEDAVESQILLELSSVSQGTKRRYSAETAPSGYEDRSLNAQFPTIIGSPSEPGTSLTHVKASPSSVVTAQRFPQPPAMQEEIEISPVPEIFPDTEASFLEVAPVPQGSTKKSGKTGTGGCRKSTRGRRAKPAIVRPVRPIPIAPFPVPGGHEQPTEQRSEEDERQFQKTIKSRESAARSNARRKMLNDQKKRLLQEEKKLGLAQKGRTAQQTGNT